MAAVSNNLQVNYNQLLEQEDQYCQVINDSINNRIVVLHQITQRLRNNVFELPSKPFWSSCFSKWKKPEQQPLINGEIRLNTQRALAEAVESCRSHIEFYRSAKECVTKLDENKLAPPGSISATRCSEIYEVTREAHCLNNFESRETPLPAIVKFLKDVTVLHDANFLLQNGIQWFEEQGSRIRNCCLNSFSLYQDNLATYIKLLEKGYENLDLTSPGGPSQDRKWAIHKEKRNDDFPFPIDAPYLQEALEEQDGQMVDPHPFPEIESPNFSAAKAHLEKKVTAMRDKAKLAQQTYRQAMLQPLQAEFGDEAV